MPITTKFICTASCSQCANSEATENTDELPSGWSRVKLYSEELRIFVEYNPNQQDGITLDFCPECSVELKDQPVVSLAIDEATTKNAEIARRR